MLLGSALFSILGFSAALTNFFLTCFVFLFCLFWNVKKMNKKSVKVQKKGKGAKLLTRTVKSMPVIYFVAYV